MSSVTGRVMPSVLLGGLLALQLVHGYVNWVHYHAAAIYSGTYAVRERGRLFLPGAKDMKRLAVQVGARDAIRLTEPDVQIVVVQEELRVTILPEGHGDWARFFARYGEQLSGAMASRWNQEAGTGLCTCVSPSLVFQGWSAGRESWVKPLDLVSAAVLAATFVGSLAARHADGVR